MIHTALGRSFTRKIPTCSHFISSLRWASTSSQTREGWLFVDSVFPVQRGRWDPRHYIGLFREETLLSSLITRLAAVKTNGFKVLALEPDQKDGGVFVKFQYSGNESSDPQTLQRIESDLRSEAAEHGGMPTWLGSPGHGGSVWLVKGKPWKEDMHRFPSQNVTVAFEGPDIEEQSLYELLRPYGRIHNITSPTPVPPGTLRSSTVLFQRLRSATIALNAIHGSTYGPGTRLRASYVQPLPAHVFRDWATNHPRIVLPILVFLVGTLTYTVFDPIRALAIKAKMLDWFDYREFRLYKWLRVNTIDRLSGSFPFTFSSDTSESLSLIEEENVWKERKDAERAMRSYLTDLPNTIAFVHGPQGSGKSLMMDTALKESKRNFLQIDCRELHKATTDSQLVNALARQTGYWPVFSFMSSMNNLIDLASVGLIGQKSGLSSSLTDQLHQILEVVGTALKGVSASHRADIQRRLKEREREEAREREDEWRRERIKEGIWHDGRLDVVAGNGVMSELGIGDELFGEDDIAVDVDRFKGEAGMTGVERENERAKKIEEEKELEEKAAAESARKQRVLDVEAVASLPVVVIRNYAVQSGTAREELLSVLAQWAATLAENQIAHVIVLSDNRENAKRLAKALPSKPLTLIALSDADATSALQFVKQKLRDAHINLEYTQAQTDAVQRLGGRASDLESLIHKVRSGQKVEEAVEDIIQRGVGELRKNAFGDDLEDSKTLKWSREQAWAVLKRLAKQAEIPYHDVLLEFPFKGDETALRSMEHADLISIGTHNGRPSTIRPGKPVYKYVFERLVQDPIFQATQDIAFNEKIIAASETVVRTCEDELTKLNEIGKEHKPWWSNSVSTRTSYLLEKMGVAEEKIERLEKQNLELKKVLAKGGVGAGAPGSGGGGVQPSNTYMGNYLQAFRSS